MVIKLYRFINVLSLDVVAGAVICSLFFHTIFHKPYHGLTLLVLALAVWAIYLADHLLDARKTKQFAATTRHQFYQKQFVTMAVACGLALACVLVLLVFLMPKVLILGACLVAVVMVYLLAQHHLVWSKEFIGAVLYTAGLLLPVVGSSTFTVHLQQGLLITQFVFTAWINLLLFSLFDMDSDRQDQHFSFVTKWGARVTTIVLYSILAVSFCIALVLLTGNYYRETLIITAMQIGLIAMLIFRPFFAKSDRYRLIGDAVFLLPILLCL